MRGRVLPSLNSIRTFEAVARYNSFTRAAEELNVTQSAASRLVKSLEDYLQVALFIRRSRRIELTDEGRFYEHLVRDALDRIEAGTVELISTHEGSGTLSIGMTTAADAQVTTLAWASKVWWPSISCRTRSAVS